MTAALQQLHPVPAPVDAMPLATAIAAVTTMSRVVQAREWTAELSMGEALREVESVIVGGLARRTDRCWPAALWCPASLRSF